MGIFRKRQDPYEVSLNTIKALGTLADGDEILNGAVNQLADEELNRLKLGFPPRSQKELLTAYIEARNYMASNYEMQKKIRQNEIDDLNKILGTSHSAYQGTDTAGRLGHEVGMMRQIVNDMNEIVSKQDAENAEIATASGSKFAVENANSGKDFTVDTQSVFIKRDGENYDFGAQFTTIGGDSVKLGKFVDEVEDDFIDMDDDDWGPQGTTSTFTSAASFTPQIANLMPNYMEDDEDDY
jgi:hypothetical protein